MDLVLSGERKCDCWSWCVGRSDKNSRIKSNINWNQKHRIFNDLGSIFYLWLRKYTLQNTITISISCIQSCRKGLIWISINLYIRIEMIKTYITSKWQQLSFCTFGIITMALFWKEKLYNLYEIRLKTCNMAPFQTR